MNEEKPDPKEMSVSDQQAVDIDKGILKIAETIDKCVFCSSIRYDTQPDFVDLIIRHFQDQHYLVIDE